MLNQKRIQLQIALEKATQEKIALQEKLVGVTKAKVSVEQKLAKVEVSLESEKKRAVALDLQLAEARKREEQVLTRIDQQDQLIQELRVKIQQLQIAQKEGGKGIETGERIASGPISTQEALVELEKIIISHRPPAEGEIIEVSEERPWVVINIGKANDLQAGIILSVLRQGSEIGRVQVEEVLEEMASARILSKEEGVQFQVADAVREL
jgi:chromosome segregation ATPase